MDTAPVILSLPYPPSANRLWRNVNGRAIKSAAYRDWLEHAAQEALFQRPARVEGPYHLEIHVAAPDRRKRDIDNLIKPLSDALSQVGVTDDDRMAQSIFAAWTGETVKGGAVTVSVRSAVPGQIRSPLMEFPA